MSAVGLESIDHAVQLSISPEKLCFIITKAREFDAEDVVAVVEGVSNATVDAMLPVSENHRGEPVYDELVGFIGALTEDEQVDLIALAWLGRGDASIDDWEELRAEAARAHNKGTAIRLLGMPALPDHLDEALSQFGYSCDDYEVGRRIVMKARDVMTPGVVSIEPEATVFQAAQLMLQNRISGLPVVDRSGKLVGIVTEGDFLRRTETGTQRRRPRWLEFLVGPGRLAEEYVRASARQIHEIMTSELHTITEDTPLDEAVRLMEHHRIKRLPVVRADQVVGIVSRANLLQALASLAPHAPAPAPGDSTIRELLLAELGKQPWASRALNVVVRDGIVELWGTITEEKERQALIVAAENIPGVKGVRDHLGWVDAMSGMVFYEPVEEAQAKTS